jgi:CRP/FNR family cyclic AMP-dependent transcriptional regulator
MGRLSLIAKRYGTCDREAVPIYPSSIAPKLPPELPRPSSLRALLHAAGAPFAVARYESHAVIFSQGDECDSVMHLETGRVQLAVTARSGKHAICGLVEPGAFLGEDVLAGHALRRQTAIALVSTEVLVIAKAQMIELLRTRQALQDQFVAHVLARHAHLEADLTDQLLNSSEQRLARALLLLAGCGGRQPCRCVLPRVSQETIAEMIGTTRSRVNAFMRKFRKLGFLDKDAGVIHVNPSLLRVMRSRQL